MRPCSSRLVHLLVALSLCLTLLCSGLASPVCACDGVVVGNVWSSRSNRLYDSMIRTYQDVFEQVAVNDVRGVGNKIVIAATGGKPLTKDAVATRSASLAVRGKFPYDFKEIVEEGYHLLDELDEKGEVLRDQPAARDF